MIAFLFIIISFPLIEVYLMIKVGGIIGAFNTISLIILTAVTGIYFARIQGINTLRSGISNLIKGDLPFFEIVSGTALAFASFLLIFPGFISDIIGFILIFPLTRKILFNLVSSKIHRSNKKSNFDNKLIEGDFEEINEDENKRK